MTTMIRLAVPADAPGVQAIYAPVVRETAISFELEPPTVEAIEKRIVKTRERWPWIVCEQDGDILGYVYASEHRTRPAYQWSVDVSVYVHANARRSGVGQALYRSLFSNYCHGQRSCRNTAPAGYQGRVLLADGPLKRRARTVGRELARSA
jgi:L-amino acid N-acyltransferase YncA